jgi:transposase
VQGSSRSSAGIGGVEHFPSYAPQLNPDEGVWSLAKRNLANSCPHDVEELMEDVLGSIEP